MFKKNISEKLKNIYNYFTIGITISLARHRYNKKMTCSISLDDMFEEDLLVEMLFKKYSLRGTNYIVYNEIKNHGWWEDEKGYVQYKYKKGYKRRHNASQKQIIDVDKSGVLEISNHSYTHRKASEISDIGKKTREVLKNKEWLEKILKRPVTGFAYPYGSTEKEYCKIVAQNHLYGRTIRPSIFPLKLNKLAELPISTSLHHVNNPNAHRKYLLCTLYPKHVFDKVYKSGGWFRTYGHSETDMSDNDLWEGTEKFFKYISNRNEVHYSSYEEAVGYLLSKEEMKYDNIEYDAVKKNIKFTTFCKSKSIIPVTFKIHVKNFLWPKINEKIGVKIDEKTVPIILDEKNRNIIFEVPIGGHRIQISNNYNSPYLTSNKPNIFNVKSNNRLIIWSTDIESDSIVYYTLNQTPSIKDFKILGRKTKRTKQHKITIPKKIGKQKIYYAIASTSKNGKSGWSDNNGLYYSISRN